MPVLAVDLGGTKIAAGVVDSKGVLRSRVEEPVDKSDPIAQIIRIAEAKDIDAIGIAVPGLVRRDGTVWAPNLPDWESIPLAKMLKKKLRVPVFVESDRNAAVLGEAWRGAARCAGWMVVTDETNEQTTRCGSLEALAAGPALGRHKDFGHAGQLLGLAVANLISLFDPQVIVLTGGVTNSADKFLDILVQNARRRAQPISAPQVEIVVSKLQSDANLLGVARLAMQ